MKIIERIKSKLDRSIVQLIYFGISKIKRHTWLNIPNTALVEYISLLKIKDYTTHEEQGLSYPMIITENLTFLGPPDIEGTGFTNNQIRSYRESLESAGKITSDVSDKHVGLLYNLVTRYLTELSAFPYIPLRTKDLNESSNALFLDIGAYRGYLSLKAAEILKDRGRVICIEPIEENFKIIEIQKKINELDNLLILKKALSLNPESHIDFYRKHNQINSEIPIHLEATDAQKIQVGNISVNELTETILQHNPKLVVMSITTNGTEIELCKKLLLLISEKSSDIKLTMVIPILYTEKEFEKHRPFFDKLNCKIIMEFPWCTIKF